jgi:hypothetical protein
MAPFATPLFPRATPRGDGDAPCGLTREGRAWYSWVASRDPTPSIWFTLTFDPNRVARVTAEFAGERARWWLRRIGRRVLGNRLGRERQLPWFYVIEAHADGRPHVHGWAEECERLSLRWASGEWSRYGLAEVRRYDSTRDGVGYLLKQVGLGAVPDLSRELARVP